MRADCVQRLFVVSALSVIVAAAGIAPAGASPTSLAAPGMVTVTPRQAAADDAAAFAAQQGVSLATSEKVTQYATLFDPFIDQVITRFGDSYAAAKGPGIDGMGASVSFKGGVPPEMTQLISSLPFPVKLIGGLPLSHEEALAVSQDALDVTWRALRTQSAGAEFRAGTTTLQIVYSGGTNAPGKDLEREIISRAQRILGESVNISVDFAKQSEPIFSPEVLSGGTSLTNTQSGNHQCTAGFAVRNTRGGTGLATASHCLTQMKYENRSNVPFAFAGNMDGVQTDIAWYSSSEPIWNKFVYTKTSSGTQELRDALSTGGTAEGDPICKYGWITNYNCTTVLKNDYPFNDDQGRQRVATIATNYITQEGDSGGPWFYNNSARGIHGGRIYYGGANRSYYSTVPRMQLYSDLRVYTTP